MTPDEHQRERMRLWIDVAAELRSSAKADYLAASLAADKLLSEFDKRFPAPSAAAPVEPVTPSAFAYDVKVIDVETYKADMAELETLRRTQAMHDAELASLRQKARLWDAVASGKVFVYRGYVSADTPYCGEGVWNLAAGLTAEEAVEAAIAAGALK